MKSNKKIFDSMKPTFISFVATLLCIFAVVSCNSLSDNQSESIDLTEDVLCDVFYDEDYYILGFMKGKVDYSESASSYSGTGEIFVYYIDEVAQDSSPVVPVGTFSMSSGKLSGYYVKVQGDVVVFDEEKFTSGTLTVKSLKDNIFSVSASMKIDGKSVEMEYVGPMNVEKSKSGMLSLIPFVR